MQRTLLASVIIMSLSACEGGSFSNDSTSVKTEIPGIGPEVVGGTTGGSTIDDDSGSGSTTTVGSEEDSDSGNTTTDDSKTDDDSDGDSATTGGSPIDDDSGSSTSDGGESTEDFSGNDDDATGDKYGDDDTDSDDDYYDDKSNEDVDDDKSDEDDSNDDNVSDDSDNGASGETTEDNSATNDDDSGSATSDGGETETDDSGSSTSDGGETETDDSGSSTSDGGETETDDSGSSTSDGGETETDDSGSSTSDGGNTDTGTDNEESDDFSSDNVGGSIIRTSTLSTTNQQNICTVASAQNNFSDMRVGDFILHNNAWRPFRAFPDYEWEQCIYSNTNGALVGWNYDWGPGITGINGATSPSGDFYVRSYPELIYGVKDEYRTSAPKSVTGFPVELGQMPNISIDYAYDGPQYGESRAVDASNNPRFPNGTIISGERNVAIESFFYNKDAAGQCSEGIVTRDGGSNHVYEVMVWLDAGAERLPAGPSDFVTNLNIRGADYKVYTKNSDSRYIAFVAQNPQNSGTIYWNDFVDWAKENAHQVQARFGARSNSVAIQDNWCMANIIVGTEIFWGSGNLDIYNWTITQSE